MTERLFDTSFMYDEAPAMSTYKEARPVGEAVGLVRPITAENWKTGLTKKEGPNKGKPWYRLDVSIEVSPETDPEYLALCSDPQGKEYFTYSIMYDADETGRPKVGKGVNIKLGAFREACGANGQPYAACSGARVRLSITQKPHPDGKKRPDGTPVVLDEVNGLTAA